MRLCIRVGMVCRLHEYVRQQDRQNAEPDVQHRCTTVFASTVHARLLVARLLVRHYWIGLKKLRLVPQNLPNPRLISDILSSCLGISHLLITATLCRLGFPAIQQNTYFAVCKK
jgi:hypothetical protein